MPLFGSKKKEETMPVHGRGTIPVDRVKELASKGFSEVEIIDVLRKEGYSPEEVDKALTQALKSGVERAEETMPSLPTMQDLASMQQAPAQPVQQMFNQPAAQEQVPQQPVSYAQDYYPTEEVVEAIVHEKMEKVDQKLMEFKMQYSELERRMKDLYNKLENMAADRSKEQEEIINKLETLKDLMTEIDGRLSSLEKAFKETLPALIESVRALSELVERVKEVQ